MRLGSRREREAHRERHRRRIGRRQRQQDRLQRPPVAVPLKGDVAPGPEEAVPELERAELVRGRGDEAGKVGSGGRGRGRGRDVGGVRIALASCGDGCPCRRAPLVFGAAAWSHGFE